GGPGVANGATLTAGAVTQLSALDLAARCLRERIGELDDARVLVGRGLGPDVLLELAHEVVARLRVGLEDDDCTDDRAALLVGRRDRGRLDDGRVGDERRLDLERTDPV